LYHTFIGMGSDESKQSMGLDPNSGGLMWFFAHVGMILQYLHVVKGGSLSSRSLWISNKTTHLALF
jgi:hypothetical protein